MAEKGMGVIYTHSNGGSLVRRNLTDKERMSLLSEYYDPHYDHLETLVGERLKTDHKCLIIDCHSFPNEPLPYEFDQSMERPDICIGTDQFHTPQWLTDECVKLFESYGLKIVVNRPFSGALVPGRYYELNQNVLSVMIEVNRKLYLDESSAAKSGDFGKTQKTIGDVLASLQYTSTSGAKHI